MTRPRQFITAVAMTSLAFAVMPPVAAAQDGTLQGLVLTGGCPGQGSELKNVVLTPRTPNMFAPVRLLDAQFQPMHEWLFPYTIEVTGEGLKSRHLTAGDTYTRPGRPPTNQVTCVFEGATKPDGPFQVTITGPIRGQ